MAGDWMPLDIRTPRKAEVLSLAKQLGTTRREILGCLLDFWIWCQDQSVDGHVDAPVDACETELSLPSGFVSALSGPAINWTRVEPDGTFTVLGWEKWLSSGTKSRLQKNLRQKKWRVAKLENVDANVDAPPSTDAPTIDRVRERVIDKVCVPGHTPGPPSAEEQLAVKSILEKYPVKSRLNNGRDQVIRALRTLQDQGMTVEAARAHLCDRVARWAESVDCEKTREKCYFWFLHERWKEIDGDPNAWADRKPPPASTPPPERPDWMAQDNYDPLPPEYYEQVKKEQEAAKKARKEFYAKLGTTDPEIESCGPAKGTGSDGDQVQGEGVPLPVP